MTSNATDDSTARKLWDLSCDLVKLCVVNRDEVVSFLKSLRDKIISEFEDLKKAKLKLLVLEPSE